MHGALVGREAELEAMFTALREGSAGRGSVLVVVGEPGIGKSALLAAAGESPGDRRTLGATGVEAERGVAFAALMALLWPVRDALEELEERQAALLRGVLELGPRVESSAFVVGAAALALLSVASERTPLAVVVDDAQWVDEPSQEVLCFVGRRLAGERIVLLAGARVDEPCLLAEEPTFRQLRLDALARADAHALLEREAGVLAPDVAARLIEVSGGNPLGLVELPRLLTSDQLQGHEPLPQALAAGPLVERAFMARVATLDAEAQELLLLLACAGEAGPSLMTRLGEPVQVVDELVRAGLLSRRGPLVELRHPLLRAAVYGAAPAAERRAAHRRLAALLDGARRAWHLAEAADGADESVALALEQAAAEASISGGVAAQADALERSAALTPDPERATARLLGAAHAWRLAGRIERADELIDRALLLARTAHSRAEVQLERGQALVRRLDLVEAQALLLHEAELAAATEQELASRLLSEAAKAADLRLERKHAVALAERALELARGRGGLAELDALNVLLTARTSTGAPPDASDAELVDRAVELLRDPELRAGSESVHWIAYCLSLQERDDEARELSEGALAEARATGDVWSLCFGLYARAALEHMTGRIDAMAAWAAEALPLAEQIGEPWRVVEARTFVVSVEAERGNPDRCRDALAATGTLAVEQEPLIRDFHLGRAHVARRLPEAIGELETAAAFLERGGILVWYRQIPLELAEAYVHAGRRDDAEGVLEAAAPGIEGCGLVRPRARLARVRALLVPDARIDVAFAAAAGLLDEVPHPLEHARLELCWGERLRRARRSEDAVPHLERALARFDALGADGWAETARTELEAASGAARPRQGRRSDELTAQELRIARHAAAGLRNREIAAMLFLSPRTIETHLQNAYRKLDVGNRTQLAAVLAADGIRPVEAIGDSVVDVQ